MLPNLTIEPFYYIIWAAAFATAILSATVGMLGGTVILAVMAQYLKMEVLIPLHGLIQFTSNFSRAWFIRESINWRISRECVLGVIIGSVVGSFYLVRINESFYNVLLGAFILFITFVPKFKTPLEFKGKWTALGFVASFVGLFIGAVGVFVGAVFLAEKIKKAEMISTQAVCQAAIHFAKVIVFVGLGFVIWPWLPLLAGTLLMTSMGSWVGTKILNRIPEKIFRKIMTGLIIVLAVRLIIKGLT